jgi:hypothetical protein
MLFAVLRALGRNRQPLLAVMAAAALLCFAIRRPVSNKNAEQPMRRVGTQNVRSSSSNNTRSRDSSLPKAFACRSVQEERPI